MINKFNVNNLRNSEHLQFVTDAEKIFSAHLPAQERLSQYYNEFSQLRQDEETLSLPAHRRIWTN
jgi:hypothetical protein